MGRTYQPHGALRVRNLDMVLPESAPNVQLQVGTQADQKSKRRQQSSPFPMPCQTSMPIRR